MKRLALCLILAALCVSPAGAKEIVCSWQSTAGHAPYRDFTCHIAGAHAAPEFGPRIEDLAPSPEIVQLVARTVRGRDIDPGLVLAVIAAESGFDRQAVSPKNAVGLMQLMPETVARFGVRDPFDAEENVRAGTSYLQLLVKKYRDLKLALAAYNAGEGPVLAYGAVPPYDETTDYVARVLRLYERYKQIPFGRRDAPPAGTTAARDVRTCGLICRGNMLAARLDDVARGMAISPNLSDGAR